MSLTYVLCLRNEKDRITPSDARAFLTSNAGLEAMPDSPLLGGQGIGVSVVVPDAYAEDASDVWIVFHVDKRDPDAAEDEILRVVLRIAASLPCEGVLFFEMEDEILRVHDARVEISEDSDFWTPERRARAHVVTVRR